MTYKAKLPDWQIVVIAINWIEEVDCNSGDRRRTYRSGVVQVTKRALKQ